MSTPGSSKPQPKVVHKLLVRTFGLLIVIAGMFFAYQWYRSKGSDPEELGVNESSGYVAALEYVGRGQRAVLIKPDGTLMRDAGWTEGARDKDLAWRPDGSFVYFTSDRGGKNFNLYRWNPSKGSANQLTEESRSRGNIEFPEKDAPDANLEALITTGGAVFSFHTREKRTPQVLPPSLVKVTGTEEEAPDSQLGGIYGRIGTSFKLARWCEGKQFIVAVMRRESGEVLVLQDMRPDERGELKPPNLLAAGERIEFDVNPSNGSVVYCISAFQWPDLQAVPEQFRKGNRVTTPARHMMAMVDPVEGENFPIAMVEDDAAGFGTPSISPDGSTIAITSGPYASGVITPKALYTMPLRPAGIQSRATIVQGEVYEPEWDPQGDRIVFAMRDKSGVRGIYTISKNGGDATKLTPAQGNFGAPKFSPQVPR